MKEIFFSPKAIRNLNGISEYIAQFNPGRAESFIDEIINACKPLALMPFMGRTENKFGVPNLRSIHFRDYLIFYIPYSDQITILNIYHGARDIDALFHDAEFSNGDEEHG